MAGTLSGAPVRESGRCRSDVWHAIEQHADTLKKCGCASSITATASTAAAPRACSRASTASASPRRRSRSSYRPLEHKGAPQPFAADCFDGDENACVDFRYSQDPRLTWWFDHHVSAFQQRGRRGPLPRRRDRAQVLRPGGEELHQVPGRHGRARSSGSTRRRWRELIEWAEIIDGALFPDAQDGRRAEGAGAAADDLHREQPRPGAGRALHRRPDQPAAGRDRRRRLRRGAR